MYCLGMQDKANRDLLRNFDMLKFEPKLNPKRFYSIFRGPSLPFGRKPNSAPKLKPYKFLFDTETKSNTEKNIKPKVNLTLNHTPGPKLYPGPKPNPVLKLY